MGFTGISGSDLGTLGLGLLIAGAVAGLVSGMLGVGGGIVIVPILYHVLGSAGVPDDLRMHIAIGTSLATLVPTSLSALHKAKADWALLKRWAAPMLIGVAGGAALAAITPGLRLTLIWGALALPIAAQLALAKEGRRLTEQPPTGFGGMMLSFGIGGLSSLMGIGGGSIGAPALTLCGLPRERVAGTAAAFSVLISVPGALAAVIAGWGTSGLPPYSYGYVNLMAFAIIAPVAFAMAPLGASIAHAADIRRLRLTLAFFVAITAAKMLWDVLG